MTASTVQLHPDSILHIYYLQGAIPKSFRITSEGFVGNWEEDGFSFLFFLQPNVEEVETIIALFPHLQLLDTFEMTYADWQGGSIDPVRIGRFILQPPWESIAPVEGEITITLNAGVVFGNGTHPTTHDCLEAIAIASNDNTIKTMLDLGTGTGILALAAAKLGCHKCLAIDFNYLAAETAKANVELNDLQENILVVNGKAEQLLARPTDLLVANIHYAVMKDIVRSDDFLQHTWFVLSGLMNSEAEKITEYLQDLPVIIVKHWHHNDVWNTFLGINIK